MTWKADHRSWWNLWRDLYDVGTRDDVPLRVLAAWRRGGLGHPVRHAGRVWMAVPVGIVADPEDDL